MGGSTRTVFFVIAKAALVFTFASWLLTLAAAPIVRHPRQWTEIVGLCFMVLLPDGLASWWILGKLRRERSPQYARGAAVAFALSAPVIAAVGFLLAEIVGGWTELVLGTRFALPGVLLFMAIFMGIVPGLIVLWAAPRYGTKEIVGINQ